MTKNVLNIQPFLILPTRSDGSISLVNFQKGLRQEDDCSVHDFLTLSVLSSWTGSNLLWTAYAASDWWK